MFVCTSLHVPAKMALNTLHDEGGGKSKAISTTRAKLSLAESEESGQPD